MVLVTGGLGFLGRRLVKKLVESGCKNIRCLVRPGTLPDVLVSILGEIPDLNLELFPASFNDNIALQKALEGVSIVYHLAASVTGSAAAMVANTVAGSDNLYQACIDSSVSRFVLVSSFSVIGVANVSRKSVIDENTPMEEHPELRDTYALSKYMQEALAWEYFDSDKLPLVVIRPGVIFGPGNQILGGRVGLNIFGFFLHLGGSNLLPLTYVDNCADAIMLAGTVPEITGEVFCIVDDDIPTSRQILRRYKKEVARLRVIPVPYMLLRLIAYFNLWYTNRTNGHLPAVFTSYKVKTLWKGKKFNNQKAKEMLNWAPRVSMKDGLDMTYSFLVNSIE